MTLLKSHKKPEGRERKEVEPYSQLAHHYNEVMSHVDYLKWSIYITRVVQYYHQRVRTVTDIACGTGKMALHLANRGYNVFGVDGSEAMIERARRFSLMRGKRIDFAYGDMRKKPPVNDQDLIICLYDSINYLMEESDLEKFFSSMRLTIAKDGMLIFDMSTEQNSMEHFNEYKDSDELTGATFFRHAWYDPEKRIQHNEFEIYPDGQNIMYYEHHQQRIWQIIHMLEMMEEYGWKLVSVNDGYSFSAGSEESDRVHIVAKPL